MDSIEIQEIVVSVLAIAFAFTIGNVGLNLGSILFWVMFLITLVTVGLGFVLHELAHRQVAKGYGAHATYKAWPMGLALMTFLAITGSPVLFAAPGAVYIYAQYITKKENGIISIAGPMTNLALALCFAFASLFIPGGDPLSDLARTAFGVGFKVNLFLALFNMIPVFPLDGSKVWAWDKNIWLGFMIGCGALYFFYA